MFLSFQEKCLLMPMYEQPGSEIKTVIVNEDVVKKSAPAVYVYEDMELRQSSGVWAHILSFACFFFTYTSFCYSKK